LDDKKDSLTQKNFSKYDLNQTRLFLNLDLLRYFYLTNKLKAEPDTLRKLSEKKFSIKAFETEGNFFSQHF